MKASRARFLVLAVAALLFASAVRGQEYAPPNASVPPENQQNQYKDYSHARIVRLSLVEGQVQISRPEDSGWQTALANMPMRQGYALATERGRAEIEFESGASVRIAEDTVLEFTELALGDGNRITRLTLNRGTATFYAKLSHRDVFQVLTQHISFAIPEDARFRVDVDRNGASASVFKGEVDSNSSAGVTRLLKGQTIFYRANDPDHVSLARNAEPDAWDRWVSQREENLLTYTARSSGYLNAPYSYGVSDLAYYGNWLSVPGYGWGWQPYGIPIGWAPYSLGRWVFINGIGWTWQSYEPWGWVPYHFGRWAFVHHHWFWIPGFYTPWHPGLVAWISFGGNVGWCPLGPLDRFGHGFSTFQNVNNVTIINTTTGVVGGTPNQVGTLTGGGHRQWTTDTPLRHIDDGPRGGKEFRAGGGTGARPGNAPAAAPAAAATLSAPASAGTPAANGFVSSTGAATAGTAGANTRPSRTPIFRPGIEYDPVDRRYINSNSSNPANHHDSDAGPPGRAGVGRRPDGADFKGGTVGSRGDVSDVSRRGSGSERPATMPAPPTSTAAPRYTPPAPSSPSNGGAAGPRPYSPPPAPTYAPSHPAPSPAPHASSSPSPSQSSGGASGGHASSPGPSHTSGASSGARPQKP